MKKILFRLFLCAMFSLAIYAFNSEYGQREITVAEAAAKPTTTVTRKTLTVGEKYTIKLKDQSSKAAVTYKSSNTKIATVSKKGVINAVSKGSATITVSIKQGGKTYTSKIAVTVKAKDILTAERFISVGEAFYNELISKEGEKSKGIPLSEIYNMEYIINSEYLNPKVIEYLKNKGIITIDALRSDFRFFYQGSYIYDLSGLCLMEEDKKAKQFIDGLQALEQEDLELIHEKAYDFVYAFQNNSKTKFSLTSNKMSKGQWVIFSIAMYIYEDRLDYYSDAVSRYLCNEMYNYEEYNIIEYIDELQGEAPYVTYMKSIYMGCDSSIRIKCLADDAKVTYKSEDKKIFTVTSKGILKPVSLGKACLSINVKQDNESYDLEVDIEVKNPYIEMNHNLSEIYVGAVIPLKANIYGLPKANIEWSSSNSKVVDINKTTGKPSFKAPGTATITVKDTVSGIKDSKKVTVKELYNASKAEKEALSGIYCAEYSAFHLFLDGTGCYILSESGEVIFNWYFMDANTVIFEEISGTGDAALINLISDKYYKYNINRENNKIVNISVTTVYNENTEYERRITSVYEKVEED